jgi:hypothetical protein
LNIHFPRQPSLLQKLNPRERNWYLGEKTEIITTTTIIQITSAPPQT